MVLTRAPLLAGGRPHTDLTITAEGQAATLTATLAASDASSSVTSIEDDHIKDEQASISAADKTLATTTDEVPVSVHRVSRFPAGCSARRASESDFCSDGNL